ncbi:hypothetical protein DBV05_g10546 [Lasiodiplodia theobromae]|uniref:Uncharacterized protein n=1 Tax=Lasiodiplodia theobromae TaxID=45133 RepID=A0A5N5CZV6_9PEZI|nr:hypothetical protein DBV05_g10546 [Lasiodiplodia theobromae]
MWPYPPPTALRFWFPTQAYNTIQDIPNHNPAQPSFDHQGLTHRPAFRLPLIPNRAYPPPPPAPQPRLHYTILPPPTAPSSLPTASTMPRGRVPLPPSENTASFKENNSFPTAAPRSPPTPESMPPPKRRRVAAGNNNNVRTHAQIALPHPTPESPVVPCNGGRCHFHRLRCGHIVKTPLTSMPTLCATNCATTAPPAAGDPQHYNNGFGVAPFECPVCVARSLSLIWKMDVVNLKKQLPTLSMDDFADWIHHNYNKAWEQRNRVRLEAWMGPAERRRECFQLAVKERSLVVWKRGETRAPYAIEEFRRVYERREVSASFWAQQYKDNTIDDDDGEAEPGVVYQSVERPGVHYPVEQQLTY